MTKLSPASAEHARGVWEPDAQCSWVGKSKEDIIADIKAFKQAMLCDDFQTMKALLPHKSPGRADADRASVNDGHGAAKRHL